jgi:hypothetical protein
MLWKENKKGVSLKNKAIFINIIFSRIKNIKKPGA